MDSSCTICERSVRTRTHSLIVNALCCDLCGSVTHRTCTGISISACRHAVLTGTKIPFVCVRCKPVGESTRSSLEHGTFHISLNQDVTTDSHSNPDHSQCQSHTSINHESHTVETSFNISAPFEVPTDQLEQSLADDTVPNLEPEDDILAFTIVETGTQKGKRKLVDSHGFTYNVKRQRKSTTDWQCTARNKTINCTATVKQNGDNFTLGRNHSHAANPGTLVAVQIKAQVKSAATSDLLVPASTIVENAYSQHADLALPEASRPNQANLIRAANRAREKIRPEEPKDMNFELADGFIPEDFNVTDVQVDDMRHLVFYTNEQMNILSKSETWYLDGTFKVVKKPFVQLFSVHAFLTSGDSVKQIPLAFCLMSRKLTRDYKAVLNALLLRMPHGTAVQTAVADFEKGIWKALKIVLPDVVIRGCNFHFTQAIWRRIQKYGLSYHYFHKDPVFKVCRKRMALSYLPGEHILPAFIQLTESVTDPALKKLADYMERTWIRNNTYKVQNWTVFGYSIRTNNDVEGWHRRLNKKAGDRKPQFYELIPLLYQEAAVIPLQRKLVSEDKLTRYQRTAVRTSQAEIFSLWEMYRAHQLSTSRLLTRIARINSPADN